MIKKSVPFLLSLLLSIGGVSIINPRAEAYDITIYSLSHNQNGRILNTSVGRFYVGKSGDAIHEVSGYRQYGYWRQEYSVLMIYIEDNIYKFYI